VAPTARGCATPGPHAVRVRLGGPTLDDTGAMGGTLLVIGAEHIGAVRRFIAEDAYMLAGVYAAVDIRPWAWGLGQQKEEPSP
jgi:hypothetical protein